MRATGTVTLFDGFFAVYQEGQDDSASDDDARLPPLTDGESLRLIDVRQEQHFTEPPPRYSEASLVKKLEELGIGRPSTYASILSTLRDRAYVRMDKNRFIPEDKGRIVTAFLTSFFKRYVEYDFTADLEEKLDEVSAGELKWKDLLRDFWTAFSAAIADTKDLKFSAVIDALDEILGPHMFPEREDGADPRLCPTCGNGRLGLKLGRFGAFIGCSNYPDCRHTRQLGRNANGVEPRLLGIDPKTGLNVEVKSGRFGPYIQLGEAVEGEKPPRAGIPKGFSAETMDLEKALQLLSLPREVGIHPESGQPIVAGFGKFGPYVRMDKQYASLETPEDVFTVGINRAVTLIAERKAKGPMRRGPEVMKELRTATDNEPAIKVLKGRYGPYVSDGSTNATIPGGADPAAVTLEEALSLIEARAAKGPSKKKKAAPKKAKAKAEGANGEAATAKPKKAKAPKARKPAAKKGAKPASDTGPEPAAETPPETEDA
jgi:DNA topoisomerase-1